MISWPGQPIVVARAGDEGDPRAAFLQGLDHGQGQDNVADPPEFHDQDMGRRDQRVLFFAGAFFWGQEPAGRPSDQIVQ